MKIYGNSDSGNCRKVKYICDFLGRPYEWVEVDSVSGGTRTAAFLALNPAGQVPVLDLGDGRTLAQSNAILLFLADGSALLPGDPFARAQVNEWLFWEQYSHEPYIAVCRGEIRYLGKTKDQLEPWRVERGVAALAHMDRHLAKRAWLVGDALTVADIALVAYTRVAHEGGFAMAPYGAVAAWVERCNAALGRAD